MIAASGNRTRTYKWEKEINLLNETLLKLPFLNHLLTQGVKYFFSTQYLEKNMLLSGHVEIVTNDEKFMNILLALKHGPQTCIKKSLALEYNMKKKGCLALG